MVRTLPNRSDIFIPLKVSNRPEFAPPSPSYLRDFVHPEEAPFRWNDGDFVDIRDGEASARMISGSPVISLSTTRPGSTPYTPPLDVHGLRFRLALLQNDLGFGLALRADGSGRPSASAILRARRPRSVSMRWRSISACFERCDQFLFAA